MRLRTTSSSAPAFAALFIAVVCVLVVFSTEGRLKVGVPKAVAYVMSSIAIAVFIGAAVGFVLQRAIPYEYQQYDTLVNMQIAEVSEYGAAYTGSAQN